MTADLEIDLTDEIATFEALMIDRCVITFDPEGKTDDVFNAATGQYDPPTPDATRIYPPPGATADDGPCMVGSEGSVNGAAQAASSFPTQTRAYRLSLPLSAPIPPEGALVQLTACVYDPALIDRVFRVVGFSGGTYAVGRVVDMVTGRA